MKFPMLALSLILAALGCGDDSAPADAGGDSAIDSAVTLDAGDDAATDSAVAPDAATTPDCPADPPTDGDACSAAESCDWLRCATSGHTAATCDGSSWTVTVDACGSFTCEGGAGGGGSCTDDQVCRQNVGGAFLADCQANPCGDMPIEKSCACTGCAPENCTINGRTVTCNTCPSGLCP